MCGCTQGMQQHKYAAIIRNKFQTAKPVQEEVNTADIVLPICVCVQVSMLYARGLTQWFPGFLYTDSRGRLHETPGRRYVLTPGVGCTTPASEKKQAGVGCSHQPLPMNFCACVVAENTERRQTVYIHRQQDNMSR
jgi:hypothetical protein